MADLYLTPAEKYTAALGGFYYGDLPEPGTVYTQLIKDILNGTTPEKEPKNILARFIYSLYISDLGDPYPRYELAKLLYWKLHDITPTKSGSILTVTIDGKKDYMTINTDLSRLWYKVLFGSKTDVITDFPYIFNTMQNKLSDWELFGNTIQNGIPTPDTPIMPQGTGERTENLFDFEQLKNAPSGTIGSITFSHVLTLQLKANTYYTMASNGTGSVSSTPADLYRSVYFNATTGESSVNKNNPVTVLTDSTGVVRIGFLNERTNAQQYLSGEAQLWINEGSISLPYENFGYKIPISSAGQTTPVYLGEVSTTRRIKKLVLTGEEKWSKDANKDNIDDYFYTDIILEMSPSITPISSHFVSGKRDVVDSVWATGTTANPRVVLEISKSYTGITSADDKNARLAKFKAYLAAQYAAGTPVTVWYVLATEETAVVNEPLMKIGDYTDSMSRTQTGIDIPTVIGQNTLDVLTTVKPSSMRIEYTSADETRSRSKRISLLKSPLKKGLIK